MLDIPELDDMVCRLLRPHDLAQCALANKTWNSLIVPHLWRNLSCITRHRTFFMMVLEDYYHRQGHQKLQDEEYGMGNPNQERSFSPSNLRKYGHLVERLPSLDLLHGELHLITFTPKREASARQSDTSAPTATTLIRHLYECCPNSQVDELILNDGNFAPNGLVMRLADVLLPRVRYLQICLSICYDSEYRDLRRMLGHCSSRLEYLDISINFCNNDSEDEEQEQGISEPWTGLKVLVLDCYSGNTGFKAFWRWLWKRCARAEELIIQRLHIKESVLEGMDTWLPNLSRIRMIRWMLSDEKMAALLSDSCSRQGWKDVEISLGDFGIATRDALMKLRSTLERLHVELWESPPYHYLMDVITSSPALRTFTFANTGYPEIPADVFIDQDPNTGTLKEWECEASLEELRIGITAPGSNMETYPGQEREIQRLVHARIARLTKLKVLCVHVDVIGNLNNGCMEMSLESGLDQLSGLKELEELIVSPTNTMIGLKEAQWMAEQWPRLRVVHGLRLKGRQSKAAQWLRQHHPKILLK
ncbi:hypothetical protein B0O80DRAFT_492259 [Mortierella sp. GBAus27b]|nr:hypothetical protein B0O80DRAFT_492259 [Mortierella sp. GBAus27b]